MHNFVRGSSRKWEGRSGSQSSKYTTDGTVNKKGDACTKAIRSDHLRRQLSYSEDRMSKSSPCNQLDLLTAVCRRGGGICIFDARGWMSARPRLISIRQPFVSGARHHLHLFARGYGGRCGWLSKAGRWPDRVASVLSGLAESIDPSCLAAAAHRAPFTWAQRLGFLLELVDEPRAAAALKLWVEQVARDYTMLRADGPDNEIWRDADWKIIVNASVEPDL